MRSQYKEAFVVVRCSFEGRTFSRCVYIWVDKDFAIARGMHQGYPKKLGTMWQTRPHPFGAGAPRIAAGGRFGATLAADDRRLAEAVLTLPEPSETNGFVNSHPMAHHRQVRPIERGADGWALDEVLTMSGVGGEAGQPGRRRPHSTCRSPWDDVASTLPVREVIGGYDVQVGTSWDGGTTLAHR